MVKLRLLLMCVLTVCVGAMSWAQAPNVTTGKVLPVAVKATPIFDGYVRNEADAVLYVEAINKGPDMSGSLVFENDSLGTGDSVKWSRAVELPENGRKAWSFRYRPSWGREQMIALEGLVEPLPVSFQVRQLDMFDVLVGVVGLDAQGLNSITKIRQGGAPGTRVFSDYPKESRNVRVGLTETYALPDNAAGYRALNWLVWPDADPSSLTPEQLDAILAWVADGGHLFLSVSDTYRAVMRSRLGEALPADLVELQDVQSIRGFTQKLSKGASGVGVVPVVRAQPKNIPDRKVWTLASLADDQPVWMVGQYGLGTVHLVPMSLRNGVLQDQVDPEDMWRRLLVLQPEKVSRKGWAYDVMEEDLLAALRARGTATDIELSHHSYSNSHSLVSYLADIPGVAPLPLSWLLAFALTYLFFIGPFDYFLLKRLKKQPWTWVTFPIYIALFSTIAMVGTSISKGSQAVVKRIDFVDVLPGTKFVRGSSYVGVFATGRTRVTLEPGFASSVAEPSEDGGFMEKVHQSQRMGADLLEWNTQTWTLAFARTNWVEPLDQFDVQVLHKSSGALVVNNQTGNRLRSCDLRYGGKRWPVGDVVVGEQEVRPSWTPFENNDQGEHIDSIYDYGDYIDDDPEGWAINTMSQYNLADHGSFPKPKPPMLVCLSDQPVEPIDIRGINEKEDAIVLIRVPFSMRPKSMESK